MIGWCENTDYDKHTNSTYMVSEKLQIIEKKRRNVYFFTFRLQQRMHRTIFWFQLQRL